MKHAFTAFLRAQSGVVFPIVGLLMLGLVASVGTAVDIGRGQLMQSKLQNALDAAGLAAGASVSTADLETEVNRYLNLNFASNLQGTTITEIDPVLSEDGKVLSISANATLPTTFMKVFGQNTMSLHAETEITRSSKGMELVMVLDTTGSMEGAKLTALKTAALDLVNILYGDGNTSAENLWIGVVPFSQAVNIGSSHTDWLDQTHYGSLDWFGEPWAGCVEARHASGRDITDDPPADEKLKAYYWADAGSNDWRRNSTTDSNSSSNSVCYNRNNCRCSTYDCNCTTTTTTASGPNGSTVSTETTVCINCGRNNGTRYCDETTTVTTTTTYSTPFNYINDGHGPNKYCPTEVTRLTDVRADIEAGINGLEARGATHIPTGAVWGWRMLSPRWQGLWGGSMNDNNLPLAYNTDLMIKAAVIMTDGVNTMYNSVDGAYGYLYENNLGTTDSTTATTRLDDKVTSICNAMKAQGIIVYTVVFQLNDAGVETMLRNCATQPDYFFNSPDAQTLQQSFRTIGDSLANLRISR